jgi:predicted lipoprotein with Yx(FWY)xxD motif
MKRTRTHTFIVAALATVASGVAVAAAQDSSPVARAARVAKVEVKHTALGSILTTSSGLTLYEFTRDRSGEDSCVKVSGCASVWPALTSSGSPVAGAGVKGSLLSTIRISGGVKQVTYAGHALYTYVGADSFGGHWYALSAAGHAVK